MSKKILMVFLVLCICFSFAFAGGSNEQASGLSLETEIPKPKNFPRKDITVIVPYAAGGAFDLAVRNLQPIIKERQNVNIVVKNVEGGSGTVGITECVTSKPDGYTLGLAGRNWVSNIANNIVDIGLEDIDYLCGVTADTLALVVKTDGKYDDIEDFIEAGKANPGSMTIGSPALNNGNHACAVMLGKALGNKDMFNTIPFSGSSRVMAEIIGGNIDGGSVKLADSINQLKSGECKAILIFSSERSPLIPDAPTLEEAGFEYWPYGDGPFNCNAIIAPPGLDPEIREYLVQIFADAVSTDQFKEYCLGAGAMADPVIGEAMEENIDTLYQTFLTWQETVFN